MGASCSHECESHRARNGANEKGPTWLGLSGGNGENWVLISGLFIHFSEKGHWMAYNNNPEYRVQNAPPPCEHLSPADCGVKLSCLFSFWLSDSCIPECLPSSRVVDNLVGRHSTERWGYRFGSCQVE